MCNPARQKQRLGGLVEIGRTEMRVAEKIASVVQRHQRHDQTA